jgi:hypothetical protein
MVGEDCECADKTGRSAESLEGFAKHRRPTVANFDQKWSTIVTIVSRFRWLTSSENVLKFQVPAIRSVQTFLLAADIK